MSLTDILRRSNNLGTTFTGPIPIISGATPATAKPRKRTIGTSPYFSANLRSITKTPAAPSLIELAFAAVIEPSFENAGFKVVQWQGRNDFGRSVGAGVYIYQIQAGDFMQTRKMILLK